MTEEDRISDGRTTLDSGACLATELNDGEQLIKSWQTDFPTFAQRSLLVGALTTVFFGMFGLQSILHWLIAFPAATAFYVIIFDDHVTWRRLRDYRWHLTTQRLIFENRKAPQDNASIPLTRIHRVRLWFWWSLKIQMTNRQHVAVDFVRGPRAVRQHILSAKVSEGSTA